MAVFVTFEKNSLFHKHHIAEFTTAGEVKVESPRLGCMLLVGLAPVCAHPSTSTCVSLQLLSEFLKETNLKRQSQAGPSEWTLWEVGGLNLLTAAAVASALRYGQQVFDCPPIERQLAYHEKVSVVKVPVRCV